MSKPVKPVATPVGLEWKPCHQCKHFVNYDKQFGSKMVTVGKQCLGDPSGKRWDPIVASKDGRCGSNRVWWVKSKTTSKRK